MWCILLSCFEKRRNERKQRMLTFACRLRHSGETDNQFLLGGRGWKNTRGTYPSIYLSFFPAAGSIISGLPCSSWLFIVFPVSYCILITFLLLCLPIFPCLSVFFTTLCCLAASGLLFVYNFTLLLFLVFSSLPSYLLIRWWIFAFTGLDEHNQSYTMFVSLHPCGFDFATLPVRDSVTSSAKSRIFLKCHKEKPQNVMFLFVWPENEDHCFAVENQSQQLPFHKANCHSGRKCETRETAHKEKQIW